MRDKNSLWISYDINKDLAGDLWGDYNRSVQERLLPGKKEKMRCEYLQRSGLGQSMLHNGQKC